MWSLADHRAVRSFETSSPRARLGLNAVSQITLKRDGLFTMQDHQSRYFLKHYRSSYGRRHLSSHVETCR